MEGQLKRLARQIEQPAERLKNINVHMLEVDASLPSGRRGPRTRQSIEMYFDVWTKECDAAKAEIDRVCKAMSNYINR